MAGYSDYSESNSSIEAKSEGRFPGSILAKRLGVKTGAVKALLIPCEWHHTSSRFNKTDFYDESEALEILDSLKAWTDSRETETRENVTVIYKEWSGPRKRPVCFKRKVNAMKVEIKGEWYKIYPVDGSKAFRKKETNIVSISKEK